MKHTAVRQGKLGGYTLIEVLIGILIFALGMMALAKLQGNLARNSGDANARTVATNIAEEAVESLRTFGQIDADGTNAAYNDIADGSSSITRGNNYYSVAMDVTDYYYHRDSDTFTTAVRAGAHNSDFKQVDLTVTWNSSQEFQVDDTQTTSGQLGSGSIRLTDVISSITSPSGGKVAIGTADDSSYAPPVDYNPGENPDIISIQLGANKFKESTTPLPDVTRTDDLVETTFDVVTYSQDDAGATFLRREEFRAVSCECILRDPDDTDEGGLRPTVWDGNDYTEGEFVSKPWAEEANHVQSVYCSICCRDHHDGGTGPKDDAADPGRSRYNAFRDASGYFGEENPAFQGDHKHYDRNRRGELVLAESDGDTYGEACRMVRKDGFWRIAQDLRQEGLNSFPVSYLDDEAEVGVYSEYVTGTVSMFEFDTDPGDSPNPTNPYETAPPTLTTPALMSPALVFPASVPEFPTLFPLEGGEESQQLRSRGIYVDYLSDVLRARINCLDNGGTGEDCEVPDVNSALEIIPFYDVQLTWLSRWNESPTNNPIDVTNEAIATDNAHDRGTASLESGFGSSTINAAVHRGNLGLTGTDPIDLLYASDIRTYDLYALAVDISEPPPLSGAVTSGEILSSVHGLKAADIEIEASGAQCDRTSTGYECAIELGAMNPRLRVFNYRKGPRVLLGCSEVLVTHGVEHVGGGGENWTRFALPLGTTEDADIVIQEDSCDF